MGVQSFQWEFNRVQCPSDAIGCASNSLRGNVLRTQCEFNACSAMGVQSFQWEFNRVQCPSDAIGCASNSLRGNVLRTQCEFNACGAMGNSLGLCPSDTIGCASNSLRGNFAIFNKRLEDTIHRACFLSSSISFESALFFLATEL